MPITGRKGPLSDNITYFGETFVVTIDPSFHESNVREYINEE